MIIFVVTKQINMGLDISHNAWHGSYSAFNRWREKIAEAAGYPPLELMEGFYSEDGFNNPLSLLDNAYPKGDELAMSWVRRVRKRLPIKWDNFKQSALIDLLTHSDCEGHINWKRCSGIADELEKLLPLLPDEDAGGHIGNWKETTSQFAAGCRLAFSKKERLHFH